MENKKQNRKNIPEGFTLSMAFMDMLPVLFFCVSIAVISGRLRSGIFLAGSVLVILAGALKVLWKFILAVVKKDIPFLNRQMRYLMPAGFVIMVIGLVADRKSWSLRAAAGHIISFPAVIFFVLGAAGIGCMAWFAGHFDGGDARLNWIEQGTNALAQFFIMLGILCQ